MQLKQLISDLATLVVEGSLDREITGITYDSRRVTPGMLFVAVTGQRDDGHDYIQAAVDRGAVAVVCQRNGFVQHRATKILVQDSRLAMAKLAATFHQRPSSQLKMIGVTGTNGKTTVAFLIKHLLETAGVKTGLLGTIRYEIGERVIPAQRTTPESLDLQQMLAQMVRAGCKACVMEVSSHALEQHRVAEIEFDIALFTNLTRDHLDYHGTMEAYFQSKKKLFLARPSGGKRKATVINIDDSYGSRLVRETQPEVLVSYGIEQPAHFRARNIVLGRDQTQLVVEAEDEKWACRLPLIGRHNIYNALAAIGAARLMNIPSATIPHALATVPPVPGRLEQISAGQPFGVVVDYAHTDDALKNVLSTLREITPGRLLLAFGCGGNRDAGKRPKMGRVAAELCDECIITSDNPRKESAAVIAQSILEGFEEVKPEGCAIELDRRRAIDQLIRSAQPGDTVLIAGKGHETYQEFEDTVAPFDDRVYALETLETLGYGKRNLRAMAALK